MFVRVDVLVFDIGSELDGVSASTVSESGSEVMEVFSRVVCFLLAVFWSPPVIEFPPSWHWACECAPRAFSFMSFGVSVGRVVPIGLAYGLP